MNQPAVVAFGRKLLLVFLGGCIGTGLRHGVGMLGGGYASTLLINALGAFLLGLFVGWLGRRSGPRADAYRLFIATGALGAFTTYSTYAVAVVARDEPSVRMWIAALLLLPIGVLLAGLGLRLGQRDG
ncbi:CrcB family protein [uncultured Tessaracoccus sp.]|uniref:fluoride efflux transporter FluC n=1 Tax=uncultured Tessaracoccus sp. TaxID=905023 RepID=UPI0026371777|nr:CrcB family protein [uncultured Tessaracoccus sp.]